MGFTVVEGFVMFHESEKERSIKDHRNYKLAQAGKKDKQKKA